MEGASKLPDGARIAIAGAEGAPTESAGGSGLSGLGGPHMVGRIVGADAAEAGAGGRTSESDSVGGASTLAPLTEGTEMADTGGGRASDNDSAGGARAGAAGDGTEIAAGRAANICGVASVIGAAFSPTAMFGTAGAERTSGIGCA